ncbi:anti-phage protein KwaA [Mucilaginibacter sp. SG564]|uniref:anti-phage protein KwaA n=1 Tax=Mucilaginibacter sp. SG564 TaxID=2587022 RepID=UPI0015572040|nr:anti-phage protein KwaA [Mucilaginibacter sp. SG564]NOW98960.1 hypothetical protein [Mucilaginibacter sp. SG564]
MTKYKIGLYIVSLVLLFVSIIIKKVDYAIYDQHHVFIGYKAIALKNVPTVMCLFFILLGGIIYKLFFYELDGDFAHPKTIKSIENISNNHLSFLATYILPFVTFDFAGCRNWLLFFFMIIIIGIIYVKTNFFYTNPTLSLFGVYVYYIDFENDDQRIIAISRKKLLSHDVVRRRLIDENIFFVK